RIPVARYLSRVQKFHILVTATRLIMQIDDAEAFGDFSLTVAPRRAKSLCGQRGLQDLPRGRLAQLLQKSALQVHRVRQRSARAYRLRRLSWTRRRPCGCARREG